MATQELEAKTNGITDLAFATSKSASAKWSAEALYDPCSATDIRRWVMAMDYPNPIHWIEFARAHPSSAVSSRRSRSR